MSRDDEDREPRTAAPAGASADEVRSRTGPVQFLREVRSELRKVAWPNRHELVSYTIVVLVTSVVLTLVVWGFDFVIREAVINTLG
jgi:preprotein translocase subunit SecE